MAHPSPSTAEARSPAVSDPLDDPRVMQAVQEYLQQLEAGKRPNRQEFLRRYADVVQPLSECLDGLDLVHRSSGRERAVIQSVTAPAEPADALFATPLGDFKLTREIGRGGMGVVYEAVQLSLGRRVALKVLPFAATLDARQLQRFHNEAQAAAQLHHTNIVPVYFVGCERGVHFYAMQLIDGQSLAVVIAEMRRQLGREVQEDRSESSPRPGTATRELPRESPRRESPKRRQGRDDAIRATNPPSDASGAALASASDSGPAQSGASSDTAAPVSLALTTQRSNKNQSFFRSAASLIRQAADALDHAHQYGIIHRDVKPANLLVDAGGRLWIMDFGVAQFHNDVSLTQTGDLLGTLRYMSPEQAQGLRGQTDQRSDIYSLGATLYELVTLEPIFPGKNRSELLHQIIHQEPKPPRQAESSIPYELETIILKAVAKNPADRYATARELAADLDRYLEDKPILAKRPSLVERTRKWLRRHPSVLVASVILLVLLTLGSLLSAWLIRQEQKKTQVAHDLIKGEQEKTKLAFEGERKRAEEAEERFRLVKRAVDDMIQWANEEIGDSPDPYLQGLRKHVLEAALGYYKELIEHRQHEPDAPELAATRAKVEKLIADLDVLQGDAHFRLLSQSAVLEEIKAPKEQRERLSEILRTHEDRRWEILKNSRLDPDERRAKILELARINEAAVSALLSKDQLHRVGQIALQLRGFVALCEPDIAAALKLTTAQRERIRGVQMEAYFGRNWDRWDPRPPFGKGGPGGGKKSKDGAFESANKRIGEILTVAQMERWNEMIGPAFTRMIAFRFPGQLGSFSFPFGRP